MTTPPKPSPEAVAAAAELHPFHDENRANMIEKAEAQQENEYIDCDRQDTALCIDRHFAPIIAKAELCDRLAAALNEVLNFRRGKGKYDFSVWPEEYRETYLHDSWQEIENEIIASLAKATRAAGPADAGGGREDAS